MKTAVKSERHVSLDLDASVCTTYKDIFTIFLQAQLDHHHPPNELLMSVKQSVECQTQCPFNLITYNCGSYCKLLHHIN